MTPIRTRRKWQLAAQGSNECDIYQFETDSAHPKLVYFKAWTKGKKDSVNTYDTDIETARGYWYYIITRGAILTLQEETND